VAFQVSYDTAANWSGANRVPLFGEWCYETDTLRYKVGDGSTAYNSLPWANIPPPTGLTDGQTMVYSASTGLWTAASFGSSEIAYAENATGTATALTASTAVDIPGCAISVAAQSRPVYLSARCYVSVTGSASLGFVELQIVETTVSPTVINYAILPLSNTTPGATYEGPYSRMLYTRARLGTTSSTRTFKLVGTYYLDSGTPTISVINSTAALANQTYILAEML
jgi:hypothetical protein